MTTTKDQKLIKSNIATPSLRDRKKGDPTRRAGKERKTNRNIFGWVCEFYVCKSCGADAVPGKIHTPLETSAASKTNRSGIGVSSKLKRSDVEVNPK